MKLSKKNKIVLLFFVLTLLLCYKFAITNTLSYYSQHQQQKEIISNNKQLPGTLKKLLAKEKQLDVVLNQYNAVTDKSFQNDLLKEISRLCKNNNLKITDFEEPHLWKDNNTKISSYKFSVEGSFNGALLLINQLENTPSLGFIKHIEFIKKRNYKTNNDYLITEVLLQKGESVKNNSSEDSQAITSLNSN